AISLAKIESSYKIIGNFIGKNRILVQNHWQFHWQKSNPRIKSLAISLAKIKEGDFYGFY
ncbi:MAG: hypothetical protein IJG55_10025, partial [Synergistaceae bacterium]|nr:hypothetical protein [Synergistaceae bacterium]